MAIDRAAVIEHMSKVSVSANDDGLIPAFGVFINQTPSNFWNAFADRMVHSVDTELIPAAEFLLVNCAHECGYHTGYGIITSEEWQSVVGPSIESVDDV